MAKRTAWKPPQCDSGKVAFRTRGRALEGLRRMQLGARQAVAQPTSLPQAVYKCDCGAWHLTRSTWGDSVVPP